MKNKPLKIGITGGIGAGKSTICRVFEWLGIPIYYADNQAKLLISENENLKNKIKTLLGPESYNKKGEYNRKFVGEKIFGNPKLLKELNALIHPVVATDYNDWFQSHNDSKYTLKEAAILFESGSNVGLDYVIGVHAPLEVRIKRVAERDQLTTKAIKARIKNQMAQDEKMKKCDFLIDNGGKELIVQQVIKIHKKLLSL